MTNTVELLFHSQIELSPRYVGLTSDSILRGNLSHQAIAQLNQALLIALDLPGQNNSKLSIKN